MEMTKALIVGMGVTAGGLPTTAGADVILDTGIPDPGFFGFIGFDLSPNQSVAVAFTPDSDARLNTIDVWFMSNAFDGITFPQFTLSLVEGIDDGGLGQPGTSVIESLDITTSAIGFNPEQETVRSTSGAILQAGVQYWIVGTSDAPEFENPVWVWGTGEAVNAVDNALSPGWNVLPGGATPSIRIDATIIPAPAGGGVLAGAMAFASRRRRC